MILFPLCLRKTAIPGDNRQAYTSIATSYEKARTKSARKKRKSGEVVSTERKKRRLGTGSKSRSPVSIRFDIQDIRSEFHEEPKCFGLIEGLGGGDG